jgi:molybdopterin-guanine dinucleotide biosynthesis protein A
VSPPRDVPYGTPYDVVVLAGGEARRLGGADKPALRLGGRSLLDHVLAGCPAARRRIVVGPRRACEHDVVWCREEPAGGGPAAGLAAGLPQVREDLVVVLAADMPFVGAAVPHLVAAAAGHDGAVLVDAEGHDQPLAAAYRRAALAARVAACGVPAGGVPMHRLVAGLDLARVPDTAGAAVDCDTWADLALARRRAGSEGESGLQGNEGGRAQ